MGFKEAIKAYGKEITASFTCGGVPFRDDDIISMNPHFEGSLLKTVMKCMDIEIQMGESGGTVLNGSSAIVGVAVAGEAVVGTDDVAEATGIDSATTIETPMFGVKAPGDSDYSYIEYGTYIIKDKKIDEEQQTVSLECYDLMLQSMIPYDLVLDYTQGITVKDFLDAICVRLGWAKGYATFHNSSILIDKEKYDHTDTFRDALDDIAEVAGGMIGFVGDELRVIYPTASGEVIDEENLKTLKIGKKYGPINSVVLSRTPQEDNIYNQDTDSITAHGLTEIRIENNQIMDSHREDFMAGICEALFGLSFTLYELESFGIGYLLLGDIFALKTADGVEHTALMLCDDLQITQGVAETSKLEEPEVTHTDYSAASTTDKTLNKAILKVDKQEGTISGLVTKTEALESDLSGVDEKVTKMAGIIVDSESVNIMISTAIGEIDSIETSTGYTFDENGLNIHKAGEEIHNTLDNTGMYVRRSGTDVLTANSDGVNAINLTSRKFLIVGNNARFEDYSNGVDTKRTACFYIGG